MCDAWFLKNVLSHVAEKRWHWRLKAGAVCSKASARIIWAVMGCGCPTVPRSADVALAQWLAFRPSFHSTTYNLVQDDTPRSMRFRGNKEIPLDGQ